jgi:hypothetical protein
LYRYDEDKKEKKDKKDKNKEKRRRGDPAEVRFFCARTLSISFDTFS